MVQLFLVLAAIIAMFVVIMNDKDSSVSELPTIENAKYIDKADYERTRIITFDIYKLKGDLLNIDRRSFRESIKKSLDDSLKFRLSYNPYVKLIASFREDIIDLKQYKSQRNHKRYYVVKKRAIVTVEYALFRDAQVTYFIDKFKYKAEINAGSYSNFDDAIYKIDKRLYWIIGKKVANRLEDNYKTILHRVRY